MISDLFTVTVLIGILSSGIRLATPYLYASIGETFGQRSGVLNLGVEGQMLLGAFAAFYVTLTTGSLWLGLFTAMIDSNDSQCHSPRPDLTSQMTFISMSAATQK